MKKETILLNKFKIAQGYYPVPFQRSQPSESEIWNKILEFSTNKNIKYLKHLIREEWVENKEYGYKDNSDEAKKYPVSAKIPIGDNYIYLDIYYETKNTNK